MISAAMREESTAGLEVVDVKPFTETARMMHDVYVESFPRHERLPWPVLHGLASLRKAVRFLAFYEEDTPAGFAYVVDGGNLLFVLFLAVNPHVRSRGYGSRILATLRELFPGRQVFLEIEPVGEGADNEEQRVRRLAFYEKNGFSRSGYRMYDGMWYELLCTEGDLDPDAALALIRKTLFFPVKIVSA